MLIAAARQWRNSLRGPLGRVLNLGRNRDEERDPPPTLPVGGAPRTPFNRGITPHRKFAFKATSLSTVKEIKNALGATVNDVVMAACAGGLRTYLEKRGALPTEPLVAMVPVSIRTGEETEKWTNRVSGLIALLPTTSRIRAARREGARGDGQQQGAVQRDPGGDADRLRAVPVAGGLHARGAHGRRWGLMARLAPTAGNLTISNVPGPREPLYAAGAKLLHYYPVSTIVDGQGLNITVQSYLDSLDWGLVACRELVPDVADLLDDIVAEIDALAEAAGVDTSVPTPA